MTDRVVVGLSGGVDSALTLHQLHHAGVAVQPVFMKNWEEDDAQGYCAAEHDLADAEAVCQLIGVRLRTVNFSYEFWEQVFETFLDEIRRGRTPNPDVLCNQVLKFRAFLDFAIDLGAHSIATGHYARTAPSAHGVQLLKGVDQDKDQSYFLHRLDQSQLARAQFPIGELSKQEVRRRASAAALPVSDKKDSTGICFVGERPFSEFLSRYVAHEPGPICSVEGERVGEHRGLGFYTIGQRQGLGIGGRASGSGEPWYVASKRLRDNTLLVAQGAHHRSLYAKGLRALDAHWVSGEAPRTSFRATAKIRHRQSDQACQVRPLSDGSIEVSFEQPQWAVAPGQSVVIYNGQECLGGAIIECALDV